MVIAAACLLLVGCTSAPATCYVLNSRDGGVLLRVRSPKVWEHDYTASSHPTAAAALEDARLLGCEVRP